MKTKLDSRAKFVALAATSSLLALGGCAPADSEAAWPDKLVFSGVVLDASVDTVDSYQMYFDLIKDELGIDVEFRPVADNAGIAEGLISGVVDIGQLDPFSYVLTKNNTDDIEIIGVTQRKQGQEPGFYSYAVAAADSQIESLEDLRGATICLGMPASLVSYLLPITELNGLGIDANPESATEVSVVVSGSVADTVLGVRDGACDVGFTADSTFDIALPNAGEIDTADFKVVWKSEIIPSGPLVVSTNLPADLRAKLTDIALNKANKTALVAAGICASEQECAFLNSTNWGWAPKQDDYFAMVREICEVTRVESCG